MCVHAYVLRVYVLTDWAHLPREDEPCSWTAFAAHLHVRLLPLACIGIRKGSLSHKYKKLNAIIALESNEPKHFRLCCASLLFDMGTEAGLYRAANPDNLDQAMFLMAMPVADHDHALHHIMSIVTGFFSFDKHKPALVKISHFFHKLTRVQAFVASTISPSPKTLRERRDAQMFSTLCPDFMEHRWNYLFLILDWLLEREHTLRELWLRFNVASCNNEQNLDDSAPLGFVPFSAKDYHIVRVVMEPSAEAEDFWNSCDHLYCFCRWGNAVVTFLHGCRCHPNPRDKCVLRGRRASEWAALHRQAFLDELQAMPPPQGRRKCTVIVAQTHSLEFVECRNEMTVRYRQVFDFWNDAPWRFVKLFEHEVTGTLDALIRSKDAAADVLAMEAARPAGKEYGLIYDHLLGPTLHAALVQMAQTGLMTRELFLFLWRYATMLIVMQLLESRHHLVAVAFQRSLASTPAAACANIRRIVNPDLRLPQFRHCLPQLLVDIPCLLPAHIQYASRAEFVAFVYGYHLTCQYDVADPETAGLIQLHNAAYRMQTSLEDALKHEFLRAILDKGSYYQYVGADGVPCVFQVLALDPGRRRYLQKVSHLGDDVWSHSMAIAVVRRVAAATAGENARVTVNDDFVIEPLPLAQAYDAGLHTTLEKFTSARHSGHFALPLCMQAPDVALCDAPSIRANILALTNDDIIPPGHGNRLVALRDAGVIVPTEDGAIVAARWSMASTICLGAPVLLIDQRNAVPHLQRSRLELRNKLVNDGWRLVDDLDDCCLVSKTALRYATVAYYATLMHADARDFHDTQGLVHGAPINYYLCVLAVIGLGLSGDQLNNEALLIPKCMRAGWYGELLAFFEMNLKVWTHG